MTHEPANKVLEDLLSVKGLVMNDVLSFSRPFTPFVCPFPDRHTVEKMLD